MLNTVLATFAITTWCLTYGLFFARELRRWWRLRPHRRAQALAERRRAELAYAAWVRNIPPPRSRKPVMPPPAPLPVAAVRRTGVVVPFPRGWTVSRR